MICHPASFITWCHWKWFVEPLWYGIWTRPFTCVQHTILIFSPDAKTEGFSISDVIFLITPTTLFDLKARQNSSTILQQLQNGFIVGARDQLYIALLHKICMKNIKYTLRRPHTGTQGGPAPFRGSSQPVPHTTAVSAICGNNKHK